MALKKADGFKLVPNAHTCTYRYMYSVHETGLVNPRCACTAKVTVVVLCLSVCLSVCLSTTILALQATRWLMSDTNGFSATRARKMMWRFC